MTTKAESELLIRLARALPDVARFVETRSMLLSGRGEVYWLEDSSSLSFVARNLETGLISIIGKPPGDVIAKVVESGGKEGAVLAFEDNLELAQAALPGKRFERAILHHLERPDYLPKVPERMVRFLTRVEVETLVEVPTELRDELLVESRHTRIAATVIDDKPVSFCYAGAVTESFWDVSIDTLEPYRKRGYAALAFAFLVVWFTRQGKAPVWGAVESNQASRNLAARLGFNPVDELFVYEPM